MVKPHNTYDCKWNWISKLYDFLFWKRHYRIIYTSMIYWIWNNIFCWLSYNGVIYQIYKLESLTVGFFFNFRRDVNETRETPVIYFFIVIFIFAFYFLLYISNNYLLRYSLYNCDYSECLKILNINTQKKYLNIFVWSYKTNLQYLSLQINLDVLHVTPTCTRKYIWRELEVQTM